MPEVTINQTTPSQEAVAKAIAETSITDAQGRVITLKKPGVLAQYRLIEALEGTAKNEVYMAMVLPLIYVTAIDGEACYLPTTKREVEAMIQRLDEDGINAVMEGVRANFGASDPEKDKDQLKK